MSNENTKQQKTKENLAVMLEKGKVYANKVLSLPNDSFEKTVMVALALCLVGAVLVSGSAVSLNFLQEKNKQADMKRNVLDVVGLLDENTNIDEAFKQIEPKLVDISSGDYVSDIDPATYDQRKAARDPALTVAIPADKDIAKIGKKAKYAKVYLVKKDGKLQSIILPVNGYGLWSTMYGFMAVEADGQTVIGLNLYDQGETPGLGGEVVNPKWKSLWKGKKIYNRSTLAVHENTVVEKGETIELGEVALGLVKGGVDPSKPGSEFQVDSLAGATLTSQGVTNLVRYWMGVEGFAPYLAKIKANKG